MAKIESLDLAIRGAEDYFKQHGLDTIFARALERLATEQPAKPISAFQRLLPEASVDDTHSVQTVPAPKLPATAPLEGQKLTDEERDVDTPPEDGYDAIQLLVHKKIPDHRGVHAEGQDVNEDLSKHSHWAGGFNRPLLDGWLPQPSPCCAAASMAGAFNAMWNLGRKHEQSATIRELAELMAQHCDKLRSQRQERLERLLGLKEHSLDCLLGMLDGELQARGLEWTIGSGPKAVTRSSAMESLRGLLREPRGTRGDDDTQFTMHELKIALGEVVDDSSAEVGEGSQTVDTESQGGGVIVNCGGPDWNHEFGELFQKRKGVMRLRAEKPHTGEIGSWGLKQAAEDLATSRNCDKISVHTLIGKKGSKVEVPMEKADDTAAIDRQWNVLKAAFSKPQSALLFHLTNHYALVYAWREWQEELANEGMRIRRQILTARKGQRPTAWLDFEEVRQIILGWSGYHILQLQRVKE